ncbi:MAG: Holliday junction branch migration protein RuvA [Clostridia bacterium]
MYAYFKGIAKEVEENKLVLDVNNIGYNIFMAEDDLRNIKIEEEVLIYTYFKHREDDMSLFGFSTKNRLEFFKKLIKVSGVGTKVALGIISNISATEMCTAIATDNVVALKSIPGIGPKMASKIIFELKDKITNDDILNKKISKNTVVINEAVTALKVLGYTEKEIVNCINDMDLENKSVQEVIKMCLRYMQK